MALADTLSKIREEANTILHKIESGEMTPREIKGYLLDYPTPQLDTEVKQDEQAFEIVSGAIQVTDPCYEINTWCSGTLKNVKNGLWKGFTTRVTESFEFSHIRNLFETQVDELDVTGGTDEQVIVRLMASIPDLLRLSPKHRETARVCSLVAYHSEYPFDDSRPWIESAIDVGVDSGQAGLFDLDWFKTVSSDNKTEAAKAFYSRACDMTGNASGFGVFDKGIVSQTGYGDGGYTLYSQCNTKGEVIAMKIIYIAVN